MAITTITDDPTETAGGRVPLKVSADAIASRFHSCLHRHCIELASFVPAAGGEQVIARRWTFTSTHLKQWAPKSSKQTRHRSAYLGTFTNSIPFALPECCGGKSRSALLADPN